MMQIIKELLSIKSIVGLEVTRGWISAVQISGGLQAPEIERVAMHQIADPEKLADELRSFLQSEGFHPEILATGLPTPSAIVREIDLPLQQPHKIEKVIKFQMEPFVPYPIDQMIVDFVIPEVKGHVLTVGVKKTDLADHLQRLSPAGLEPRIVGLADLALFLLYCRIQPDKNHAPVVLVHLASRYQTIHIIHQKRLELIRVLQADTIQPSSIQETISLFQLKNPADSLQEILVTGEAALTEGLCETIAQTTGIKTSLWKPFDHFKFSTRPVNAEMQNRLSVPLGLAIAALNGSSKVLNLRKEDFRVKTALELKRRTIFMVTAFLCLLTLLSLNLWYDVYLKGKQERQLAAEIKAVFQQTFPGNKNIPSGSELKEMENLVKQKKAQYQWIDAMLAQGTVLETVQTLTDIVTREPNVRLENISVDEGKTIHVDGFAPTFKAVDTLKESLEKSKFFKTVNLVSAKAETMDMKEKAVKFNLVLERK